MAAISLCRCCDSLPLSCRFLPESHGDRTFSVHRLERFRRSRPGILVEETGRSPGEQGRVENMQRVGELVSETDRCLRVKDTFVWLA